MDPILPTAPVTLLTNARIYTMDPTSPQAEAIAWQGDRLLAVGSRDDVAEPGRCRRPGHRRRGPHGAARPDRYAYPLHVVRGGAAAGGPGRACLAWTRRCAWWASGRRRRPPGTWVRGHGWDNNLWAPTDLPHPRRPGPRGPRPSRAAEPQGRPQHLGQQRWRWNGPGITRDTAGPPRRAHRARRRRRARTACSTRAPPMTWSTAWCERARRAARPGSTPLRLAIANAQRAGLTGFHDCEDRRRLRRLRRARSSGRPAHARAAR